jgi:predicted nuclease of predicted toxin-antitoxin system
VKVKLDENLPAGSTPIFARTGHDVDTVEDEGLAGRDDPTVARTATEVGRLIVTLDRGFGDVHRYPPGSHAGILVLRVDDQSAASVRAALTDLIEATDLDSLAGCVAVFRSGNLRVRRPPEA